MLNWELATCAQNGPGPKHGAEIANEQPVVENDEAKILGDTDDLHVQTRPYPMAEV